MFRRFGRRLTRTWSSMGTRCDDAEINEDFVAAATLLCWALVVLPLIVLAD